MSETSGAFTEGQLVEMLRRSYLTVDGLWFVMCEQALGFETALDLDERVWHVMPKIQARKAREVLRLTGNTPPELARAVGLKLAAEGHDFGAEVTATGVAVTITGCPWRAALEKAQRLDLASRIARRICQAEGDGWAAEFGGEYEFAMESCQCEADTSCRFAYRRRDLGSRHERDPGASQQG